jgi:hypothetical protein
MLKEVVHVLIKPHNMKIHGKVVMEPHSFLTLGRGEWSGV